MKRTTIAALALSAAALPLLGLASRAPAAPLAQSAPIVAGTYRIDAGHSSLLFRIQRLKTSWFYGRFGQYSGQIVFDDKAPQKSSVEATIEVGSVDTGNEKRDDHLRSPDFLDAVQFSTASFKSKSVEKTGERKYAVAGDLELHGVTKPATIELEQTGWSDTKAGVRIGFLGKLVVKRSEFGIGAMPDALGDEVELILSIEATRTETR